jgi:hypothetical protein
MRNLLRVLGFVAFLMVLPAAHAADVSGTWKGAFDVEDSNISLTLHFTVANGALTGTLEGLPVTPVEIHDGKVDGDTVTFWANTDYQGQTYKLVFKGTVNAAGDQIAFTFGTDDGSWGTDMTATKATGAQ